MLDFPKNGEQVNPQTLKLSVCLPEINGVLILGDIVTTLILHNKFTHLLYWRGTCYPGADGSNAACLLVEQFSLQLEGEWVWKKFSSNRIRLSQHRAWSLQNDPPLYVKVQRKYFKDNLRTVFEADEGWKIRMKNRKTRKKTIGANS